ncbi:hypothetical protein CRENBAI_015218 [Crenichthys baileyi]|uniref:Uncharacterized protein n=1 Tax=Crenichthys baileyi TaxID=28760 RepID=A0AAV9RJE5_9TELE
MTTLETWDALEPINWNVQFRDTRMNSPSSCLHFGPTQNHIVTEGTSQNYQADKAQELQKWMQQQEEELRKMYGEEVEILPSPMLLQEMEEARLSLPTPVSPGFIPGPRRSGLPPSVSATSTHRRPPRRKRSTSAAAAAPELDTSTATPASTVFPAGFGSRPGQRRRRRAIVMGEVQMGIFCSSTEGPSTVASSRLSSPELVGGHPAPSADLRSSRWPSTPAWVQAGMVEIKKELMKSRCLECVPHLVSNPQDLADVHAILLAEFLKEGWLDAPAPLSAGGPFDPLLYAVMASQGSKEHAAKPLDSQHAAKPLDSQHAAKPLDSQHTVMLHEPQIQVSDFREGFKDEPPQNQVPEFREDQVFRVSSSCVHS